MANEYAVNSEDLRAVAEAIRTKGGTAESLAFPDGFIAAIESLETGGSTFISLYEAGVFGEDCPHFDSVTPSSASIAYEEGYIRCTTVTSAASEVYAVFGPISLDHLSYIVVQGAYQKTMDNATQQAVVFAAAGADASYTDAAAISTAINKNASAGDEYEIVLDVTALEGAYYLYTGTHTDGSAWRNVRKIDLTSVTGA